MNSLEFNIATGEIKFNGVTLHNELKTISEEYLKFSSKVNEYERLREEKYKELCEKFYQAPSSNH